MKFYKQVALLALPMLAFSAIATPTMPIYAVETAEAEAQESHPAALNEYKGLLKSYDEEGKRFIIDHQSGIAVYYNDETVFIKDKKVVSEKELDYGAELVVISDHSIDPKEVLSEEELDTGSNYSHATSIAVARLILIPGEDENDEVYVDHFHLTHGETQSLQADHKGMSITIEAETKYDIKNYKGEDLDLTIEDLDGKTVAVLYTAGPETHISKDVIIPLSFKFILLDQLDEEVDAQTSATVSTHIDEEAEEIEKIEELKPTIAVTLPAVISMLDLLPEYANHHKPQTKPIFIDVVTLPAKVDTFPPVFPTSDFLELLPDWAGGKLHPGAIEIEKFETEPNMKLEKDASASLVSEIVDEILEEIAEEDYYTGVEVLVDEEGIEIKVVAE